jgi:phage terminase small subunit
VTRLPPPPRRFGEAGKREWRRALRAMQEAGFLELPTDIPALDVYCGIVDRLPAMERAARDPRCSPEFLKELEDMRALKYDCAKDMGLTPGSRQAIRRALKLHPLDPVETARRKAVAAYMIRRVRQLERAARARERRPARKGRPAA